MSFMVLGVMFPSLRDLFPYVIHDFRPGALRGSDGGLGKGGWYRLAGWESDA